MNGGTFNLGYEAIEVNNLSYERNIAKKNWDALKMTFRDMMDVEYDPNNDIIYNMMVDVMNGNHNPSWLKVATIGCEFRNISRICLAQITRDTGWIWNSESQMPQRLEHNITVPLNIAMNEQWLDKLEGIQNEIEELYNELIDAGIPYQDARYIGLHGQTISIYGQCDVMSFIRHCGVRLNNNIADEINYCYRLVIHKLHEQVMDDYYDGLIDRISFHMWKKLIKRMDCNEAKFGKVRYFDRVFCNSFDRFPSDESVVEPAPMFDIKKSAWYEELRRMPKELLLNGEQEMLDRLEAN